MKYYLIVGEASGDLHASHLMAAIKERDANAQFRFLGGDMMLEQGGELVKHYRDMAYMGFVPVLLHLREILNNIKSTKKDILAWNPDVLILVDYPGFNLKIAQYIHAHTSIKVYYYIAPKIWAWKEHRIKNIKRDVDELFSILPFEVDFFENKHHFPIHYVGNPTFDEIAHFNEKHPKDFDAFVAKNQLDDKPIIALLAGSRKQEIKDNLPRMIRASEQYPSHQVVLAAAPGISIDFYHSFLTKDVKVVSDQTYSLLQHADVALVTSGTATLETALFNVPQIVCYYTTLGKLVALLRKLFLKVKYISLVNLIADKLIVKELVADKMNVETLKSELEPLLNVDSDERKTMLKGYEEMRQQLIKSSTLTAAEMAAKTMINLISSKNKLKE